MDETLFNAAYLLLLVAITVVRYLGTRGSDRRAERAALAGDPVDATLLGVQGITMLILPLVYIFTPWLSFANYARPVVLAWLGILVFLGAIWLLWRSHADLGRNWNVTAVGRREQQLVTGGVFSRLRHPMYAAHLLWAVAQALLLANWLAGPLFVLTSLPFYWRRIRVEERLMEERFGPEYRRYRARTGGLLPRLGR